MAGSWICFWLSICQGSEYTSASQFTRVLNMSLVLSTPGFWICLWFSICQVSEYASGSKYARFLNMPLVLNIPGFWMYQNSKYITVFEYTFGFEYSMFSKGLEYVRTLSEYVWIYLNIPEYAWRCLNGNLTYFNGVFSLREHKTVFLKRQTSIFSVVAGSIAFVFCFRLKAFTCKISIFCCLLGPRGPRAAVAKNKYNQGDVYIKYIIPPFLRWVKICRGRIR